MRRVALTILGFALAGTAGAGWFGPSNYDECILEHLKGVSSDMGARMVAASCAKQFPPKKVVETAAPPKDTRPAQVPDGPRPGGFTDFRPAPAK
jgi:hypothetical protein